MLVRVMGDLSIQLDTPATSFSLLHSLTSILPRSRPLLIALLRSPSSELSPLLFAAFTFCSIQDQLGECCNVSALLLLKLGSMFLDIPECDGNCLGKSD